MSFLSSPSYRIFNSILERTQVRSHTDASFQTVRRSVFCNFIIEKPQKFRHFLNCRTFSRTLDAISQIGHTNATGSSPNFFDSSLTHHIIQLTNHSCYKCFVDEATLLEHIPKHKESKHLKVDLKMQIPYIVRKEYQFIGSHLPVLWKVLHTESLSGQTHDKAR
jgi:hypothetical protein